jgi:glycosyltransferase involved in cell wall biosynthesis
MSVAILMPVYDEAARLERTLAELCDQASSMGGVTVFVVDDGSQLPVAAESLPAGTASFRVVLARHAVNLGQGAALETARQLALGQGAFDVFVTMDSDGQHRTEDVASLVAAVRAGADVAFGNRFLGRSEVTRPRSSSASRVQTASRSSRSP